MATNDQISHPLLPRLKEGPGNKIENFPKRGTWHARPAVELERLSVSLKSEELEFEVNSIPDMWGRPILFEMALFDEFHPLHKRIRGEWRGMLTLLALRKMRRFSELSTQPLEIPTKVESEETPEFLASLSRVIPKKNFADDSSWEHVYIILFRGVPIGITSPVTLVCTSTYYCNVIDGVSWYDGKFLVDPIPHLNPAEKHAVAGWMKKLKSSLLAHPNIKRELIEFDRLLSLIDTFIGDLGGVQEDIALSNETLGMKVGIFKYLDKPVLVTEELLGRSHVQIVPSKVPVPGDALLVVDKEIAKQWEGVEEKDIVVYRSIPLDRISASSLVGDKKFLLGTPLVNAQWCTPDDFFTENLILIKQKNAFTGTAKIDGTDDLLFQDVPITPIIPLTDLILRYLETNDIADRLRFEQVEDEIKVVLSLPLTGPDERGKDFEISKTYHAKKDEIESLNTVPILEIWPNFISDHWKAYYTYYSNTGDKYTFYATPLNSSESKRSFEDNRGQIEREISSLERFPEIFDCKIYRIDPKNKKPTPYDAGILLIQKPDPLPLTTKDFKVGVDFGTSGTNVFAQHGNFDPERMVLMERFFKIAAPSAARRSELYDYFLPGLEEKMPFLSIFHNFLLARKAQRPLLDGHIYFLLDHKTFDAARSGIITDLKWGDKTERTLARAFLEQLCLQCSAEASANGADKISWRFSYPTAFSSSDEEAFISIWNQITGNNNQQTGIKLAEPKPIRKSESIASASYFSNDPDISAPITEGAVFADIGGRTSDISIWQGTGNPLLAQTSLQFAGRDIFSYPLWKKTPFLNDFCDKEEMDGLLREKVQANEFAFYAQLDAVVNAQGTNMLKKLPNFEDEQIVKEFEQLIAIGISGLFYYIGLMFSNLTDSGAYRKKMPNIYLGGNGSRLLHWLAAGDYNPDSAINRLFKGVFRKAYGIPGKQEFGIHISPDPKAEVACGLVTDKTPLSYDKDKMMEGFFIAGETFEDLNDKKFLWNTQLSVKQIKAGVKISSKLEQLETFLEAFDEYAKSAGILPIGTNSNLSNKTREQVNQALSNLSGTDENAIHIEPLFIIAMKKLLQVKVGEWANK